MWHYFRRWKLYARETVVYFITEKGAIGWRAAAEGWQPGCIFTLYCGSTVWPASQCNPQTIPCCYSIARTAVMVLHFRLVIFCVICTIFILQPCRNHMFTDGDRLIRLPIIYLPKDVQKISSIFCRYVFCPLLKQARRFTTWNTHSNKKTMQFVILRSACQNCSYASNAIKAKSMWTLGCYSHMDFEHPIS